MFCDLVGSSEISARLDPEEWREVEDNYLRAAAEAITRFGGFVAKYMGAAVLAYFGWPEAHDNDAERAARAALAILEGVAALNQRDRQDGQAKLSVRVGIDSGTVVIGRGGGTESEVFGNTANVASRVQSAADPDTVIVTPAVHRLISGLFVVEERGAHQLKGIAQPVELYRIVRLAGARSRLAASAAHGLTPFVGRADEIGLLLSRWKRASEGEGQVVFIAGEAGIGKSRLVRQFRNQLAGTPHTWNECAGASYFQNTPFYPITDMLQQGFAQRGDETDEKKLSELEREIEIAGLKLAEAVPLIAEMLNVPVSEKYPPLTFSPEQKRNRLLATLARWLFGASQAQPLVMAVEDLHWFDASSLEVMQLLVEQGATSPLLLLFTARPEFHAPWAPRAHHTHLTLNRLTTRDVRELVGQVVANSALSGDTIEKVIERTDGVPLFVEELTRAVLEKGDAKPALHEIPATLHDSLMARLDRLGPAKEVAQVASVIGREFSYELLLAVSTIPEGDLQSALAKLGDGELIYARGIPPEATYTFKHALIQDAAYEALLKSRCRELHRRVAVALTEKFPTLAETRLEVVARHWTDAGEAEPAIASWRKAGDAAFERNAFKEAEQAYRQTLAILRGLPESRERDRRELELMKQFSQVLVVTHGWAAPETAEAAAHAQALAENSFDLDQLVFHMFGTWAEMVAAGDLGRARASATKILELAEREGSAANLGLGRMAQLVTCYFGGDLHAAEKHFAAGLPIFTEAARKYTGVLTSIYAYPSHTAWMLGLADTARDRMTRGLALVRESNSPFELMFFQYLTAMLYLFLRESAQAKICAAEAVALADEHGFQQYTAAARIYLGLAEASLGRFQEGIALARFGIEGVATKAPIAMTFYLSGLAQAQGLNGEVLEALLTATQALEVNPQELAWRPDAFRIRGELRLASGNPDGAEADFREAIALAQQIGAKALELRAAMSLARQLKKRGNLSQGRDLLAPIYSAFDEGFDTPDLKDAKALLKKLNE